MAPIIWGVYLFLHRLNNHRSFNHRLFHIEFFLEAFLFWIALSSLLSKYLDGVPNSQPQALLYIIFGSVLAAYATIALEQYLHEQFM